MKNPMSPLPVFITVTPQPALSHLYSCSHHHGVILKQIPEAVFKWLSREFTLCSKKKKMQGHLLLDPVASPLGLLLAFCSMGIKYTTREAPPRP